MEAEFFYQSQPRLQLIFDSPNHCATILGMLAILLTAWAVWGWKQGRGRWIFLGVFLLMAGFSLWGLAQTYSRGGWVAFFCGWSFLFLFLAQGRWILGGVLGIFFSCLLLLPHGPGRAVSIMKVEEDLSIAHRLMVWRGAMSIAADHPIRGVGSGKFGTEFGAWYQPLDKKTRYSAALNNGLTVASEWGLAALWLYLSLLLIPLACLFPIIRSRTNAVMLGILSAQLVHLVSGMFTYSLSFWHVNGLFTLLYLVGWGYLFWSCWWSPVDRKRSLHLAFKVVAVTCVVVLCQWLYGNYLLLGLPTRVEKVIALSNGETLSGIRIRPQGQATKGWILYYHEKGESVLEISKSVLRPLAKMGYIVISFDYRAGGRDGLVDAIGIQREIKDNLPLPYFVAGRGVGGRMAFLAACHPEIAPDIAGIAAINMDGDWPFPELSPLRQMERLQSPLLIVDGLANRNVTPSAAMVLPERAQQYGKTVEVISILGMGHDPGERWPEVLSGVAGFFETVYPKARRKGGVDP
jgi:hypothetical protein